METNEQEELGDFTSIEKDLDFGAEVFNDYLKTLLLRLGKTLTNKARMQSDAILLEFFSSVFTPKMCYNLTEALVKLEKLFPEEAGKPVITANINESAKVSRFSPLSIIEDLEKQAGIPLNKKGLTKHGIKKHPNVIKVVKPRNTLTKKKSWFSKADDVMKPKTDIKGRFVKQC